MANDENKHDDAWTEYIKDIVDDGGTGLAIDEQENEKDYDNTAGDESAQYTDNTGTEDFMIGECGDENNNEPGEQPVDNNKQNEQQQKQAQKDNKLLNDNSRAPDIDRRMLTPSWILKYWKMCLNHPKLSAVKPICLKAIGWSHNAIASKSYWIYSIVILKPSFAKDPITASIEMIDGGFTYLFGVKLLGLLTNDSILKALFEELRTAAQPLINNIRYKQG